LAGIIALSAETLPSTSARAEPRKHLEEAPRTL